MVARSGQTPIFYAVTTDRDANVQVLLDAGANANFVGPDGLTALATAKLNSRPKTAALLTEAGAATRWNAAAAGSYIKHLASVGDIEGVVAVVDQLAVDGLQPANLDAALLEAVRVGSKDCVEYLLELGADAGYGESAGNSCLFVAICERRPEIARVLLAHGADANAPVTGGMSPLAYSMVVNFPDMAAVLTEYGAELSWGEMTEGPVFRAAETGDLKALRRLLAAGLDPDPLGPMSATPLAHAIANGHVDCVKLLLENGANPEGIGRGDRPLHRAAAVGSVGAVKLLLEHGADINSLNEDGDTPLAIARSKDHDEVAALLEKNGGETYRLFPDADTFENPLIP
jgi:ankyrin repeat protein